MGRRAVQDHAAAFADRRGGVARQLRALQIRSAHLLAGRRDRLRPSRSVDLHGADLAVGNRGHRQHRLRDFPGALGRGGEHLPPALVPHEHHVGVHGADLRRLRRQAGRLCPPRHQPAQHDAAARPGSPGLRSRVQRRAEAGEANRHHGLHVRDPLPATRHRACGEVGDLAGRLRRLLERTGETVRSEQAVVSVIPGASKTRTRTLEIPRCATAHRRSGPSNHPGMTAMDCRNIRRKYAVPHPNDPKLRSFIPVDPASDFPIQNLPYGVFSARDGLAPRVGVAIGDYVLDLWELEQDSRFDVGPLGVFSGPSLNAFMALGPKTWSKPRARISELLRHDQPELRDNDELRKRALVPMADVKLHLPIAVSGYTDFYSSKEHATNVGVMFRGKDNALQPNWLHMPIGYNGRASTVVVSGTKVRRPR